MSYGDIGKSKKVSAKVHLCVLLFLPVCKLSCFYHASLCTSMDYSLQGSSVFRISQARILELFAISFSRGSS